MGKGNTRKERGREQKVISGASSRAEAARNKKRKDRNMAESSEVASSKQTDVLSSCRGDDLAVRIHGGGEAIRRSQPLQ